MNVSKIQNYNFSFKNKNREVINTLKDKQATNNRNFFGFKKAISEIIEKAEDPRLAIANLKILLNTDKDNLSPDDIYEILETATKINNRKINDKYMKDCGFEGGLLDEKSISSIKKKLMEEKFFSYEIMTYSLNRNKMI